MASNETAPQLPNPFTPLAFLPPDIAFQITIASYILVGTLGVLVWDILNNLAGDFKLLFKHRISLPTIAYFLSRCGSLAYVLASTLFETAPTGNCPKFEDVITALFPLAIPTTSLLFFFRVRAVFDGNKYVVGFFAFMWLAVLGTCITVTRGVTGINIGPTNYCLNFALKNFVSSAGIVPLINDTLIFFAISYKLMSNTHVNYDLKTGFRTFLYGEYLPAFSKSLFQDGQMYYLTTVTTNLLTVIMLYVPAVPITYRTMFTVPNIALTNIMACRIFRKTKLGIRSPGTSFFGTTSRGTSARTTDPRAPGDGIPLALRRGQVHDTTTTMMSDLENSHGMTVDVIKTIEHSYDTSSVHGVGQKKYEERYNAM